LTVGKKGTGKLKSVFNHFAGIKKPPEIISRGEWGRFSNKLLEPG
jgi:hypothetical protein